MKTTHWKAVTVVTVLLASSWLVGVTVSESVYDPWCDLDEDGDIDIFDIVRMAGIYGTTGDPFAAKAALEYDSGWVNITDKRGRYFNITHNLDSTNVIFDITGKESSDSEPFGKSYGLTTHIVTEPGWTHTYGGPNDDYAYSVIQAADGGFVIAGCTDSFGAGSSDAWLVKTDASGNHLWTYTFGGPNDDYGYSVVQTPDGGYTIAGCTASFGAGDRDFWLLKADSAGNHLWNHTYGGPNSDEGQSLVQTAEGGFVIAGCTDSFGAGSSDAWLVKTDASGNHLWNHTYGGPYSDEVGYSVIQAADGGYAVAGYRYVWDPFSYDAWLVKTDAAGNHLWNQTYRQGEMMNEARSVVQTLDGGYAFTGFFSPFSRAWLVKTDASGNHLWNHSYGIYMSDISMGCSVIETVFEGYVQYVIAGGKYSVAGTQDSDIWLIRTNMLGETDFQIEVWLAWTASLENTITLYRGWGDPYWNYVQVRIWTIKDTP
jgi:hypothetical protein